MVKKRKIKIISTKQYRAKREISLFSEKEKNYESDIRDKTNPDQVDSKYLLQL